MRGRATLDFSRGRRLGLRLPGRGEMPVGRPDHRHRLFARLRTARLVVVCGVLEPRVEVRARAAGRRPRRAQRHWRRGGPPAGARGGRAGARAGAERGGCTRGVAHGRRCARALRLGRPRHLDGLRAPALGARAGAPDAAGSARAGGSLGAGACVEGLAVGPSRVCGVPPGTLAGLGLAGELALAGGRSHRRRQMRSGSSVAPRL
mmetsp:Transcript_2606/g.7795  ORF Transcript_2606/g.7795 Transcript_2606/m.7795 type:complete len:205 (-) Transcript_2606:12-626(-)